MGGLDRLFKGPLSAIAVPQRRSNTGVFWLRQRIARAVSGLSWGFCLTAVGWSVSFNLLRDNGPLNLDCKVNVTAWNTSKSLPQPQESNLIEPQVLSQFS